jgi:hypothetical protein
MLDSVTQQALHAIPRTFPGDSLYDTDVLEYYDGSGSITMMTSRKAVFAVTALRLSSARSVFGRSQRFFGPLRPLALGCGFKPTTVVPPPSISRLEKEIRHAKFKIMHLHKLFAVVSVGQLRAMGLSVYQNNNPYPGHAKKKYHVSK